MIDPAPAQRRKTCRGFTLMEILVVLMILSILAGIVGLNVLRQPAQARVAAARMQIKTLRTALQMYYADHNRYPTQQQGLEALVRRPAGMPPGAYYPQGGYLETPEVPLDPWGNPYIYLAPGRRGEPFEIISYGSDGEPGGEGDAADISSSEL